MDNSLSIEEFEALVTMRALTATEKLFETFSRMQIGIKMKIAANEVIEDFKLKDIFRAKTTVNGKVLLLHIPTGKVACEICVDGNYRHGIIRRPKAILMDRKGYIKATDMLELAKQVNSYGKARFKKEAYARNHQS
ncbi:hypothetical protein IKD67_01695 [Candidatus Saccharibacteria bacterium]|nr:hypothetical protein [Candidatus Saccharibacteria bacterium]